MLDIKVTLSQNLKQKPADESSLGFGRIFTDHMFLMDYEQGVGWNNARIVPYGSFAIDPAAMVLHYGQAIFEGSKCYRRADGGLQLFRPQDNLARMSRSAERMGMPALDEESALEGLKQLIKIEEAWVPHKEGTSLYIRPTMISMDVGLGVHASKKYLFFSDEPDWVEHNICNQLAQPYEIMRGNKAWEDLWLLAHCPIIVASQGSFGRVAAQLNPDAVLIQCDNEHANRERKNTYLIK